MLLYVNVQKTKGESKTMPFQKIVIPTMKEMFIQQLEAMILSGELQPGEKLPNERELAAKMNVSRTIANSGIQELARNGFVSIVPRKGTFVNNYLQEGNLGTLTSIVRYNNGHFNKELLNSLMEYRIINESKCAYLAAKNHSDEDIEILQSLMKKLKNCQTTEKAVQTSIKIHHAIFTATHNIIFPMVYNTFGEILESLTQLLFQYLEREKAYAELSDIISAIKDSNAEEAEARMKNYSDYCSEIIAKNYR